MRPMRHLVPFLSTEPRVAVLRLQGVIASGMRGTGLSDAGLAPLIERAFRRGRPAAVALSINSPGGAAAQSSLIAGRIRRLAEEKRVPVYAFVEDVAASGGYWLATAGDEIWADASSMVGSIGVVSAGFGLHEFIARHGIERRVHTAGEEKAILDPFRPERPEDVERLKELQRGIHDAFIAHVRERRGARLGEAPDLFSGRVWLGAEARRLGLIDGIGHLVPTMRERFGDKVRFVRYQQRRPLLGRFALAALDAAGGTVAERLAFARYGL